MSWQVNVKGSKSHSALQLIIGSLHDQMQTVTPTFCIQIKNSYHNDRLTAKKEDLFAEKFMLNWSTTLMFDDFCQFFSTIKGVGCEYVIFPSVWRNLFPIKRRTTISSPSLDRCTHSNSHPPTSATTLSLVCEAFA